MVVWPQLGRGPPPSPVLAKLPLFFVNFFLGYFVVGTSQNYHFFFDATPNALHNGMEPYFPGIWKIYVFWLGLSRPFVTFRSSKGVFVLDNVTLPSVEAILVFLSNCSFNTISFAPLINIQKNFFLKKIYIIFSRISIKNCFFLGFLAIINNCLILPKMVKNGTFT